MKKSLKSSAAFIPSNQAAAQKAEKQEQVFQTFQEGAGEVALAANAARTQCLDAVGERFDRGAATLEKETLTGFFAAMEIGAPKSVAKHIAMHPMRPAEVDAIVEAAEAEAKVRKQEEQRQRKIEALQKRLAAREEDERKLAELHGEPEGGKAPADNTPDLKTSIAKGGGNSGASAEA